MANSPDFHIGKRLSYDGNLCTVRYVGEVHGTNGQWLGVEWDEPGRGKHDGQHGGIRYFQCARKHPTVASFIRPNRPFDQPRSFVDALRHKYASESANPEVPGVSKIDVALSKEALSTQRIIKISGKEVEEVGFEKIRRQLAQLHELRIVLLDGLCISRLVETPVELPNRKPRTASHNRRSDIKDICPKVTELDVSCNLFEDWREITSICEQLCSLRTLKAEGNRFRTVSLTPSECEQLRLVLGKISTLSLKDTLLQWEKIVSLAGLFSNLTSLNASSNWFGSLDNGALTQSLHMLILEFNDFTLLSDLAPLQQLSSLQTLILKNNRIHDVTGPHPGEALKFPESLKDIDLSYNAIEKWKLVDQLEDVFPGLFSLRISHNPLFSDLYAGDGKSLTAEDGYMLTIARLPKLQRLNYSPVSEKERLNSETYYLSLIARELVAAPEDESAAVISRHRRYAELCEEYGDPTVQRKVSTINPNSLAARLLKIRFYLGQNYSGDGPEPGFPEAIVEIPRTFSVYSVLGIVGKRFDLAPMQLKLVWETEDWETEAGKATEEEYWDSDASNESALQEMGSVDNKKVRREVEIVTGTRSIGTWVEGSCVTIRVEMPR